MRPLEELLSDDPAWPLVQGWVAGAAVPVEVLPAGETREEALVAVQVTTRSTMGAVVYETGGILVDDGWLRVLGSGHSRLPRTLGGWNAERSWSLPGERPSMLIVADDAVGGSFAVDGGALGGQPGEVHYFAPDTLAWEPLEMGYSDFLGWALSEALGRFAESLRWPGWRQEVAALPGDEAISVYPPLWAKGPPLAERSRRPVPMEELLGLQFGQGAPK